MIDETPQSAAAAGPQRTAEPQDSILAYCQQCGRGLTASTQRRVGAGIFCEPCAAVRSAQAPGWRPVTTGTAYPAGGPGSPASSMAGEPNPMLAGFLGLIPGVGAMFNGQYAKGVIHLIIFVVLVSLADNLNWVLWWFVWGWIFYQGFEAYHTAQARRDGQPLPDPFGWNELGERLGFAREGSPARPAGARPPVTPPPAPSATYASPASAAAPFAQAGPDPYAPAATAFSPVSHAPYSTADPFGSSSNPAFSDPGSSTPASSNPGSVASGFSNSGTTGIPYTPIYTGNAGQTLGQAPASAGTRRFPAGAAWLIGLGILFLLGNLLPTWHMDGRWLVPILLAAIGLWTGGSRLVLLGQTTSAVGTSQSRISIAGSLLWPCLLITMAVLLALQDASLLLLRHSWPVLLIVWGGLLLLQRAEDARQSSAAPDPGSPAVSATAAPESSLR